MAELKIRRLDARVVSALRARAKRRGISLEEEVRRTLSASVSAAREAFLREAEAVRARTRSPADPRLDSARIIRDERDGWG